MEKLRIFENNELPDAPNALAIFLFVSAQARHQDERARALFIELAEVLGAAGFTEQEQVLVLKTVDSDAPEILSQLPRLANGDVYTGISAIESYVSRCRKSYENRSRVSA